MIGKCAAMVVLGGALLLSACQSTADNPAIPTGQDAYSAIPIVAETEPGSLGALGPGDVLSIDVLREPELSTDRITVDPTGKIEMPLVGEVLVTGLTTGELNDLLTNRLGARYLRDPRIAVNLVERRAQTITVEGEVQKPGIFPVTGEISLLGALALAESPTELAKADEIFVFRKVDGAQMGARFDLRQLRSGLAPDPQILPGDVVVVGFSSQRSAFQDFLRATPLLNIFTVF
ncbi:polysaccharide biosynthesis/export family protein [Altererythrobacter sp. ZODW24]|uniref:polysaccharide biosynthesis/export family protein n=1 Tax=Altererythrobacter sp. ZODW24 TaxID=2185142 RepID=UPI000DF79D46|nr:polysaccharide biosynthesis/export family protein [Altererythrobacter sp. ZODW24]